MSVKLQALLDAPIIELDTIDSTNNYAMRLIDADTAQDGLTLIARHQTQGKGQRGKSWQDDGVDSLLMSLIVCPAYTLDQQFVFSAAIAVAIADTVQLLCENSHICIKWPNDIIVNDKKAGGILIENVLRGSKWMYAIIGLGLNVKQASFPSDLPLATSLFYASGKEIDIEQLGYLVRRKLLEAISEPKPAEEVLKEYNDLLYRKGQRQLFTEGENESYVQVCEVLPNGQLMVQHDNGSIAYYTHGIENWKW